MVGRRRLCDCEDHLWRNMTCKHILACQLREGDVETVAALRQIILPAIATPRDRF